MVWAGGVRCPDTVISSGCAGRCPRVWRLVRVRETRLEVTSATSATDRAPDHRRLSPATDTWLSLVKTKHRVGHGITVPQPASGCLPTCEPCRSVHHWALSAPG